MWIAGLGIVLAAASHASWRAALDGTRLAQQLRAPAFRLPASAGLILVTVSMLWGATPAWERALWAACSIVLAWQAVELLRRGAAMVQKPIL